jgi:hypothetical protein
MGLLGAISWYINIGAPFRVCRSTFSSLCVFFRSVLKPLFQSLPCLLIDGIWAFPWSSTSEGKQLHVDQDVTASGAGDIISLPIWLVGISQAFNGQLVACMYRDSHLKLVP